MHLVDLVLSRVRVQRVFLAGLEGVETDEQPRRFEDRGLAHLRGRVDGVIGRTNDRWMIHVMTEADAVSWFSRLHVETPVVERERHRLLRRELGHAIDERLLQPRIRQPLEMRVIDHRRHELTIVRFGGERRRRLFETGVDVDEAGLLQSIRGDLGIREFPGPGPVAEVRRERIARASPVRRARARVGGSVRRRTARAAGRPIAARRKMPAKSAG